MFLRRHFILPFDFFSRGASKDHPGVSWRVHDVFRTEEKDSVMENQRNKKDMARCLIDTVIGKGERASRIMIYSIKERDHELCSTLCLKSSLAGVGELLP